MRRTDKQSTMVVSRKARDAGDDTTIHLRLTKEDRHRLRAIIGFMLDDPHADAERVSYAGALRYSMRLCVERPPAHVKHQGRNG